MNKEEDDYKIQDYERGIEFSTNGEYSHFEFLYPPYENEQNGGKKIKYLCVDLCHVRASDGMRIHYDFERDGYVIEQPTRLCWESEEELDYGWKESAFIQSWEYEEEQQKQENKVCGVSNE